MAPEPKFFSKNFIDANATKTASTGQGSVGRVLDRDTELQWASVGSNNATTETIDVTFLSGGSAILRTFDFLAVLNHNLDTFKFQHDIGAGFVDTPGAGFSGFSGANTLIPISQIANAEAVRLSMDTTQGGSFEKLVGEIFVLKRLWEPVSPDAFAALSADFRPVAKVSRMMDHGIVTNQIRWTGNRVERWRAAVVFSRLIKAEYDKLRSVVKQGTFTIQPEPDERPGEFFEVTHIPNNFPWQYSTPFKPTGYEVRMVLEEK